MDRMVTHLLGRNSFDVVASLDFLKYEGRRNARTDLYYQRTEELWAANMARKQFRPAEIQKRSLECPR